LSDLQSVCVCLCMCVQVLQDVVVRPAVVAVHVDASYVARATVFTRVSQRQYSARHTQH